MKRFLLISLASRFGGGETYLEQLAPILRDRVRLVVFCIHPEVKRRIETLGIETFYIGLAGNWQVFFRIPLAMIVLLYFRVKYGINGLILNGHAPAALALPARLMGYRSYVVAHLNLSQRKTLMQRLFLHRRYLFSLHFAYRVICVSEPVARELRAILPMKDISVISNWISHLPPFRKHSLMSDSLLTVLFVGRLVDLKGLHLLIEAIRRVSGVRLSVVGEGERRMDLERMAQGLDVQFAGFQQVTGPFFQAADLFVNPSLGPEGLPMVSLEAMSNGLPCILSDLPVHVEISAGGFAASLFRSGSVDDLVEKISQFIKDDRLRLLYAERAQRRIAEHYGPAVATRQYLRALEIEQAS